jgi:hypothetical protein
MVCMSLHGGLLAMPNGWHQRPQGLCRALLLPGSLSLAGSAINLSNSQKKYAIFSSQKTEQGRCSTVLQATMWHCTSIECLWQVSSC